MTTRRADWPTPEERLAALHDKLVTAVEDLASSASWMRMLQVASRFPDYSPSNVLLIAAQRPDATRVAGIRTWNTLGRHVLKGEHGIAILAPCICRPAPGNTADHETQPAPVAEPRRPEPATATGKESVTRRELRGFKVVHVFDLTQTDGEPLPDVAPELLRGAAPENLWDHLAGLVQTDGFRIERGPCGGANGYTSFGQRVVRVRDDVDPAQAVKTLAHELGHIRADHEHRFPDYAFDHQCRGQAEVEAESIAYLITASASLESASYSVPYVAGWARGDAGRMREAASRAIAAACRIVEPDEGHVDSGLDQPQVLHIEPAPAPSASADSDFATLAR